MSFYRIELTPDDNDSYLATSPDFPELTTYGDDQDDALGHASHAVEEAIAARIAHGAEVPQFSGSVSQGKPFIRLTALTTLKVTLYRTLAQKGVTRAELSRRLGWHREQVDRLFRLDHASRLDQIEAAFAALGVQLDLSRVVEARPAT
ncbi:MAG TPA: type II toxin-antitoxin system HicB family antitoxin [Caulobacteraceae bacterium]|jgi:antitoxin HicB|nr:type II toxin-antitoxin system HicB family antitoxin [Caulobacteraceae bacterium]